MMSEKEQRELLEERYQLVLERIREIPGEQCCGKEFKEYLRRCMIKHGYK